MCMRTRPFFCTTHSGHQMRGPRLCTHLDVIRIHLVHPCHQSYKGRHQTTQTLLICSTVVGPELTNAVNRNEAMPLFLPKCSPWLNPIERGFGQFKKALKKDKDLLHFNTHLHVMAALRSVNSANAQNYMAASGCHPTTPRISRSAMLMLLVQRQWNKLREFESFDDDLCSFGDMDALDEF